MVSKLFSIDGYQNLNLIVHVLCWVFGFFIWETEGSPRFAKLVAGRQRASADDSGSVLHDTHANVMRERRRGGVRIATAMTSSEVICRPSAPLSLSLRSVLRFEPRTAHPERTAKDDISYVSVDPRAATTARPRMCDHPPYTYQYGQCTTTVRIPVARSRPPAQRRCACGSRGRSALCATPCDPCDMASRRHRGHV